MNITAAIIEPDPDAMRPFHETVWGRLSWPDDALLAVVEMRKGHIRTTRVPVHDQDAFVGACVAACARGADAYVAVAPQPATSRELGPTRRGGRSVALGLPALFVDIDVAGPGHHAGGEAGALPLPTEAQALELMRQWPLQITALVSTGGGFHAWSCLTTPLDWQSADGQELLRRWKAALEQLFVTAGFHLDVGVLADPARILRIPGTFNQKTGSPRPVRLVDFHVDAISKEIT
jgi:hypothetical protein